MRGGKHILEEIGWGKSISGEIRRGKSILEEIEGGKWIQEEGKSILEEIRGGKWIREEAKSISVKSAREEGGRRREGGGDDDYDVRQGDQVAEGGDGAPQRELRKEVVIHKRHNDFQNLPPDAGEALQEGVGADEHGGLGVALRQCLLPDHQH